MHSKLGKPMQHPPITPQQELAPSPSSENHDLPQDQTSRKLAIGVVVGAVAVLLLIVGYALSMNNSAAKLITNRDTQSDVISDQNNPTNPPTSQTPDTTILYSIDATGNSRQSWLYDITTKTKRQLDVPSQIASIAKRYGSQQIYYTRYGTENAGTIHIKNLAQDTSDTELTPLVDSNPEVHVNLAVGSFEHISPDDQHFVFDAQFTIDCEPIALPSGLEAGGFGPCLPEQQDHENGFYIYSITQDKITKLADTFFASNWDLAANKFYFVKLDFEETGLYGVDLTTHQITLLRKSNTFGMGAQLMSDQTTLVLHEAETGDSDSNNFSRLSIGPVTSQNLTPIDSGSWATIQPFIMVSPDEKFVIYQKNDALYIYSRLTQTTRLLTTADTTQHFTAKGEWVSNTEFVTMVRLFDNGNIDFLGSRMIKIDITDGSIEYLTEVSQYTGYFL